jgi:hypothetical protein
VAVLAGADGGTDQDVPRCNGWPFPHRCGGRTIHSPSVECARSPTPGRMTPGVSVMRRGCHGVDAGGWRPHSRWRRGERYSSDTLNTIPGMNEHDPGLPPPADHPLKMSGRGAIYSFSFDLGPEVDLIRVANKLLKNDVATVAGSPSRQGLRVGRRLRASAAHQEETQRFSDFLDILNSGNLQWYKMFRLNWKTTMRIAWAARKLIAPYLLKYLIIWMLYGQAGIESRTSTHEANQPPTHEPSDDQPDSIAAIRDTMKETAEKLRKLVFDQHISGALRLRLQQQMYFPHYYLETEPFIRLEMNRSYYTDQTYDDEPIEISLMIHRSGVCIFTFATPIAHVYGVDEAYGYLAAGTRLFDKVEISAPILGMRLRYMNEYYYRWRIRETRFENLDWVKFETPADGKDNISLESVFYLYLNTVERIAGRRAQTEWRCNTTLFQGSPRCGCDASQAKEMHAVEFAQMMVRARSPYPVTDEAREQLLKNYLVNSDEELWLSTGHAIHTIWDELELDYTRDLKTVEPIESAILQHRQLEAIDHRTVNVAVRDHNLFAAQKQLATGLPEYGRNLMTDINAASVVEGLAEKFRTPQLYDRLNDRVKVLESIVNTRYARRQSRRSLSISAIGLGVVLLLLLPRIDELMTKLSSLTPTGSLIAKVRDYFGGADQATVALYLVAIGLAALVLLTMSMSLPRIGRPLSWLRRPLSWLRRPLSWLRRPLSWLRQRLRIRIRNFGYPTKHDVIVTRGAPSPPPTQSET